ncbi:hypothetical protein N7461_006901 [Penicillium sp. DV-2018c]|nr:hypothetical protein N7461_006901 [Penicillium sp. DV-2018c]
MDETTEIGRGPSLDAIGQFSFAPTTRTTVVTTTTTTTTSFPPLTFRPPRAVKDLDTRQYPLAAAPTPDGLRSLKFKIGDQAIVFNEPEDKTNAAAEYKERTEALKSSKGQIRSVNSFISAGEPPVRRLPAPRIASQPPLNTRRRAVTPATLRDNQPSVVLPRTRQSRVPSEPITRRTRQSGKETTQSAAGLATPDTEHNLGGIDENAAPRPRVHSAVFPRREPPLPSPLSSEIESKCIPSSNLTSFLQNGSLGTRQSLGSQESQATEPDEGSKTLEAASFGHDSTYGAQEPGSYEGPEHVSQLSAIDNAMARDMCLPSPSLSPVAAMNAMHGESFDSEGLDFDADSSLDHKVSQFSKALRLSNGEETRVNAPSANLQSPPSLLDMPKVLEFFDAVPDEVKTYLMYQFLRRCPKPTLHFVADVVNPTLKCDFLALLPLELSLNIVKYLDVKTMCRAAQVSKKWRHITNSDEKSWKSLLDQEGFDVSDGEVEQAIKQGWGWQLPNGPEDPEQDLSMVAFSRADYEASPVPLMAGPSGRSPLGALSANRRAGSKRKANTRASSRKLAKRKISSSGGEAADADWKKGIAASEAPYAAANAAAAAVPYAEIGLPSLRGLFLFKVLYRRHIAIRKTWMQPSIKPKHIAFRAHDRHVVTCLQFDADKVLTGSDDTNIHVYDTRTGALQATLAGHEGGVWALEYYGNTLVSGSTDRSVRVWDIERARCTQVFHGHTSTVRCLQILMPAEIGRDAGGHPVIMPKEPLIITGSRDSSLRVWKLPQPGDPPYHQSNPLPEDTDCPYFLRALTGHTQSVRAIAAHGDTLVSGSYDFTVKVWKISTGQTVHTLQGHTMKVYSVVLDHKRNRCISGSMDHMVKVWSLDDGSILYNLEGHTSLVGLLALEHDFLVSAAADSTLRIWDSVHGHCKNTLSAHTGAITCFQHDDQKVISGSDRTLKMWDVRTGECVRDLLTDLSGVWQVKFNNRRCVAAVQRDRLTYIEVLDFGAVRDGVPESKLSQRIVVNRHGREVVGAQLEDEDDLSD